MDKKKTIKEMRKEIEEMIKASQERQGRDVKSEMGSKAMKAKDTAKNFQGGGYSPKTKVDGSKFKGVPKSSTQEYKEAQKKKETKPRQRPGAGREAMMAKMEEERKRRQRGESAVVGS